MKDKISNFVFAMLFAILVFVVLEVGYIAIFKHKECITREDCHEIIDSVLTDIYD